MAWKLVPQSVSDMKATAAITTMLALCGCAELSPQTSAPLDNAPRLELQAETALDSLSAIHEQLLLLRERYDWLKGYGEECYWRKPIVVYYEGNNDGITIHLQLFTHGKAPLPLTSYDVAIIGADTQYDILGYISASPPRRHLIVAAIREAFQGYVEEE